MNKCKTCKHWQRADKDQGMCKKIENGDEDSSELAYMEAGYNAGTLITKAVFGCVLHEATKK